MYIFQQSHVLTAKEVREDTIDVPATAVDNLIRSEQIQYSILYQ